MLKTEIRQNFTRKTLGLTFVLSAAALAFAQQQEKVQVTGNVTGNSNDAVPYATVTFINKNNASANDAALSDDKGHYEVQLAPGTYDVTVEAINYSSLTQSIEFAGARKTQNFVITRAANTAVGAETQEIQGVVLTAQANKPYRVEIDKKIYDPSQDIISKGGNLQDVLTNVPSVSVDTDGTVSMRGNSNIRFLINGKPSSLLGIDDGADALKSIPADQIERIEVITNPSSKFEASGTAGILNIILKQNKRVGFNGTVTGSIGYLPQTSLNANLNWRKGAWTYYINGGGNYRRSKSRNNSEYQSLIDFSQLQDNELFYSMQNGLNKGEDKSYNVNTGFFVDLTEKSSLNASVLFRTFDNESSNFTDIFERIAQNGILIDENTESLNEGFRKNNSFQADLGFEQKIGDNGQLLSLSTSFQKSASSSENIADEYSWISGIPSGNVLNNIFNESKNTTFLAKADYELPIGENSKLEAGARFDANNNDYNYYVDESINGGALNVLPRFTSDTYYDEKITAGYAQFKSKIGNFGYQLGLRAENTDIGVSFRRMTDAQDITVDKNYTGFFPSAFLSYDLGKNNQLLLNYSRRIQRPRSWFLVPFSSFNRRNLFSGNPDLNPTYENSFELGYSLSKGKLTLNPTLYYKKSQDEINMYQFRGTNEEGSTVIYTRPVNAGSEQEYGLDMNVTYDPFRWWKIMSNIDLYSYKSEGSYEGFNFDGDGFSGRVRLTNTFKPDKDTSFQIQGFWRGGEKTVSMERKAMYAINLGASRNIWDGNGTIAFNIQDIFNTRSMERIAMTPSYTQYNYNQWQPRQFTLSLTYRFREGEKIDQPRKRRDNNNNYQGDDDMPPM